MRTRTPAVAGAFYPADASSLRRVIEESYLHRLGPGSMPPAEPRKIYGAICPHAGYVYSGPVACHSFHAMSGNRYNTFVVIGPNHWGVGRNMAAPADCLWETPLGDVEVDSQAARRLAGTSDVEIDFFSHSREHSIEVQIPMIQQAFSDFRILPVAMIDQTKAAAIGLGMAVARMHDAGMMVIGSSDFTHYEPEGRAREQDMALIGAVLELDVHRFYDILEERQVSACGYGAVAATMVASRELGATRGELLKYATSGDVTGDMDSVVGYGSVVFV